MPREALGLAGAPASSVRGAGEGLKTRSGFSEAAVISGPGC